MNMHCRLCPLAAQRKWAEAVHKTTGLGFRFPRMTANFSSVGETAGPRHNNMDKPGKDQLPTRPSEGEFESTRTIERDLPEATWQRRCNQTAIRGEWGGNDESRARGSTGTPRAITRSLKTAHTHTHTRRL